MSLLWLTGCPARRACSCGAGQAQKGQGGVLGAGRWIQGGRIPPLRPFQYESSMAYQVSSTQGMLVWSGAGTERSGGSPGSRKVDPGGPNPAAQAVSV